MAYREIEVTGAVASRISCVWTNVPAGDGSTPGASETRVVPDGCMDIIWGPEGLQLAGPDTRAHLFTSQASDAYLAVRFRPGGAGGVFGVPADALVDERVAAADLWGEQYRWAPPTGEAQLDQFWSLVEDRVRSHDAVEPAAPAIRHSLGRGATIPEAAAALGMSERTLRRRTIAAFGYPPKVLQRILRFQRALELARSGEPLAAVAHGCGYADQAHLSGDVRRLAGVPITQL